jgi:hypothetical protein
VASPVHLVNVRLARVGVESESKHTGCVGWPSMMDCSHSIVDEKTVGHTGGFSYTAPEKARVQ